MVKHSVQNIQYLAGVWFLCGLKSLQHTLRWTLWLLFLSRNTSLH